MWYSQTLHCLPSLEQPKQRAAQEHDWTPLAALHNLPSQGQILAHILRFYICSPIHFIHIFFKTLIKLLQSCNSEISVHHLIFSLWKASLEIVPPLLLKPIQRLLSLILATQYSLYSSLDKADKLILMLHRGGQGHIRVAWFAWMQSFCYWPSTKGAVKLCGHSINSMRSSASFLPSLNFIE